MKTYPIRGITKPYRVHSEGLPGRTPHMGDLSYGYMQRVLMDELRLYHVPIAIKYIFGEEEFEAFKEDVDYFTPMKNMTFCQWEIVARMKRHVLATPDKLGCSNASYVFGWRALSDAKVLSNVKYLKDEAQTDRFLRTKPRLEEGKLKAVVVAPLADTYFDPDTVHFCCDNMQAYHLAVDYMSARETHPLTSIVTINSSACAGNVCSFLTRSACHLPACLGSCDGAKTWRAEVNFIVPGEHIEATVVRMLDRKVKSCLYCGTGSHD